MVDTDVIEGTRGRMLSRFFANDAVAYIHRTRGPLLRRGWMDLARSISPRDSAPAGANRSSARRPDGRSASCALPARTDQLLQHLRPNRRWWPAARRVRPLAPLELELAGPSFLPDGDQATLCTIGALSAPFDRVGRQLVRAMPIYCTAGGGNGIDRQTWRRSPMPNGSICDLTTVDRCALPLACTSGSCEARHRPQARLHLFHRVLRPPFQRSRITAAITAYCSWPDASPAQHSGCASRSLRAVILGPPVTRRAASSTTVR